MIRYVCPFRAVPKLNGLQRGQRERFNVARFELQAYLANNYPKPQIIRGDCVLYWCIHMPKLGRADSLNLLDALADMIAVDNFPKKHKTIPPLNVFPLIANDRQLVGFPAFPEYGRLNRIRNSPRGDLVEFGVEGI